MVLFQNTIALGYLRDTRVICECATSSGRSLGPSVAEQLFRGKASLICHVLYQSNHKTTTLVDLNIVDFSRPSPLPSGQQQAKYSEL